MKKILFLLAIITFAASYLQAATVMEVVQGQAVFIAVEVSNCPGYSCLEELSKGLMKFDKYYGANYKIVSITPIFSAGVLFNAAAEYTSGLLIHMELKPANQRQAVKPEAEPNACKKR